ncbi:hypothetical protein KDD17_07135 [Sulfitobacter albidus]|uniref:Uncharacterized protein n=1 Tax=Sulfitobacter albidus TaxID=2829501 RepID=A0A975JFS4_9RHOB|nr:hypothetical protein [Sulfitobacter albidus]QUJ77716.1 hypothetical protein KDD17_07135 [Sulfitobacter albidus]
MMRTTALLCAGLMALAACDPAEFDPDPDVRRDARASRTCQAAVKDQTGDGTVQLNTTLPIVEINQYIIDAPGVQEQWMCRTDDEGNATQLYKLGVG